MNRRTGPAQYLLRFDDLCPQMNGAKWKRFLPLLKQYDVSPILAIVPDNRDVGLAGDELGSRLVEEVFWEQMRELSAAGATIGMHGFQHLCLARGPSLVPLHGVSEFAGVEAPVQRAWIQAGIEVLGRQGLVPQVWVAPRHGFDRATVKALRAEGIEVISDGFAVGPFRWLRATWLPQQVWGPVERKRGLWTICVHPATVSDREVKELGQFLERFAEQFTSVERVLAEWEIAERSLADRLFHLRSVWRLRLSRAMRRIAS